MSPTPLWPASYPHRPATIPPSTTPHIPGTSCRSVAFMTWHVEVPMMATIWPGSTARAAGAVTWASTLPTAIAMPSGSPVQAAARAESDPARSPSWPMVCVLELVGDKRGEARVERRQEGRVRIRAVLVYALVASSARVADVGAGQLPHDPVRSLDEVVHRGIQLRGFLKHLQPLGELPLRGDQAAVPRQPRFAASAGEVVDPVRLRLRSMVAPKLDERVRTGGELRHLAQGGTVGQGRDHRAGGKVGTDPDHVSNLDTRHAQSLRYRDLQNGDVVGGHLQSPLRRERFPRRQRTLEHSMGVVVHGAAQLLAVTDPDHNGSTRERAVVDADDHRVRAIPLGGYHLRPLRRPALRRGSGVGVEIMRHCER